MKKILIVEEKHTTRVFDISIPKLRKEAYLQLFHERKQEGYYSELLAMKSELFVEAKNGNARSAERIIWSRRDYEYEMIKEVDVENT